jgi:hypothetical protein
MKSKETTTQSNKMIRLKEARVLDHLAEMMRGPVEEALNGMP